MNTRSHSKDALCVFVAMFFKEGMKRSHACHVCNWVLLSSTFHGNLASPMCLITTLPTKVRGDINPSLRKIPLFVAVTWSHGSKTFRVSLYLSHLTPSTLRLRGFHYQMCLRLWRSPWVTNLGSIVKVLDILRKIRKTIKGYYKYYPDEHMHI